MSKILEKYDNLLLRLENKLDDNIKIMNDNMKSNNEKMDKILETLNQERIDNSRNTHCLFGNGQKGLVERVENLENTQEKHSRYFWLINIIYTAVFSTCVFIINKIWR